MAFLVAAIVGDAPTDPRRARSASRRALNPQRSWPQLRVVSVQAPRQVLQQTLGRP